MTTTVCKEDGTYYISNRGCGPVPFRSDDEAMDLIMALLEAMPDGTLEKIMELS